METPHAFAKKFNQGIESKLKTVSLRLIKKIFRLKLSKYFKYLATDALKLHNKSVAIS